MLYTLDEDQLGLLLSGQGRRGQIVNAARVVAAVARLERVDAEEVRVGIDLDDFDWPARTAHRAIVHRPAKRQRKIALGDRARQCQPLAEFQTARLHLLEGRHLGRH